MRAIHPLQVMLCFFLCLMALSRLVWMQLHPYERQVTAPVLSLMQQAQQVFPCSSLEEIHQTNQTSVAPHFYDGPLSAFYIGFLVCKCGIGDMFSLQDLMRLNLWLIVVMCILVLLWMRILLGGWLQACVIAVALLFRNALVSRIYLVSLQPWASLLLVMGLFLLALALTLPVRTYWRWAISLLMILLWGGYEKLGAQEIDFSQLSHMDFWYRWCTPMMECMDLQYLGSLICTLAVLVIKPRSAAYRKSVQHFFIVCLFLFGYSLLATLQEGPSYAERWNMVVVIEPLVIVFGIASLFQWIPSSFFALESKPTASSGKA
jgi:hypothetical protein